MGMQRCVRYAAVISSETICTAGEPPWKRTRSAMSSAVGRGPAEATVVRLAPSTPKMVTHGRVASARVIPPRPKMVGEGIAPPRPKPIATDGGVSSVEVGVVPPTPKTSTLLPPTSKTSTLLPATPKTPTTPKENANFKDGASPAQDKAASAMSSCQRSEDASHCDYISG